MKVSITDRTETLTVDKLMRVQAGGKKKRGWRRGQTNEMGSGARGGEAWGQTCTTGGARGGAPRKSWVLVECSNGNAAAAACAWKNCRQRRRRAILGTRRITGGRGAARGRERCTRQALGEGECAGGA